MNEPTPNDTRTTPKPVEAGCITNLIGTNDPS